MQHPEIYTAKFIKHWDANAFINSKWIPCRPVTVDFNLFKRIKLAWHVFIGKYDALDWENEETHVCRGR